VLLCAVYLAVSSSSFIPLYFFFRKYLGSEFKTSERPIIIALRKRVNISEFGEHSQESGLLLNLLTVDSWQFLASGVGML